MDKRLREAIAVACKDTGLTDKALDELANIGGKDLKDDSTEEEIKAVVDSLMPYAKLMQGEITRKTRRTADDDKKSSAKKQSDDEGEGEDGNKNGVPDWFREQMKTFSEKLDALQSENKALKEKEAATTRANLIQTKAKERNIPEYLMKHFHIEEDADIDSVLDGFKQDLVNNNLMPKQAPTQGDIEAQMKAEAEAWAKGLPDK